MLINQRWQVLVVGLSYMGNQFCFLLSNSIYGVLENKD